MVILLVVAPVILRAQTPSVQQSGTATRTEPADPCKLEPAYEVMLDDVEWKNANTLYQILVAVKPRDGVTTAQRANIRTVLLAMADGARKPDPELLNTVADDFAEGAALRKLTTKQKAGLAVNMQSAMGGVNNDYMPNVSSALAFINGAFEDAGMNRKRARKIVDDVYALVAKARAQ